jgi:hypothetical protein
MIEHLIDLFTATVHHQPVTGRDAFGDPSHGPATAYKARIVWRQQLVHDQHGNQSIAHGQVWIAGTPIVSFDDRLNLPDGSWPQIVAVELNADELGLHHVKIFFG